LIRRGIRYDLHSYLLRILLDVLRVARSISFAFSWGMELPEANIGAASVSTSDAFLLTFDGKNGLSGI
jgi:hypothetical protein